MLTLTQTSTRTATPIGGIGLHVYQQGVDGYNGSIDTYLDRWATTTNYGTGPELNVRYHSTYIDEFSSLLRFDLSDIRSTAYIQDATLTLWVTDRTQTTWVDIGVYRVLRDWGETQATWNEATTGTNWNTAGCNGGGVDRESTPVTTVRAEVAAGNTITINLHDVVSGWVANPNSNHGLLLRPVDGGAIMTYRFASASYWTVSERPLLTVAYGGTPTTTPTWTATPTATPSFTPLPTGAVAFQQGLDAYGGNSDSYLEQWGADINYGNARDLYLRVAGSSVQAGTPTPVPQQLTGVMQFDVSALPPGTQLDSAILELHVQGMSAGNANHLEIEAYQLLHAWAENTVTWRSPWTSPGADGVGTDRLGSPAGSVVLTPGDVGGWITMSVTSLVQGWVNDPGTNHGLLLRPVYNTEGPYGTVTYDVNSSEHYMTLWRPRLVVVPAPAPTPTPSPTWTPNPGPTCVAAYIEAEDGTITQNYIVGSDDNCSSCAYIYVPTPTANNDGSEVVYNFYIPQTGQYYFYARTNAPNWSQWQQKWAVDGDALQTWSFPNVGGGWTWGSIWDPDITYRISKNLTAGWHQMRIGNRLTGAQVDALAAVGAWDCVPNTGACASAQGAFKETIWMGPPSWPPDETAGQASAASGTSGVATLSEPERFAHGEYFESAPAGWVIEGGSGSVNDSVYHMIADDAGNNSVVHTPWSMTYGRLRARALAVGGTERGLNAQIVFDYHDTYHYKIAGFRVGEGKWVIRQVVDGDFHHDIDLTAPITATVTTDTWYQLDLVVGPDRVTLYDGAGIEKINWDIPAGQQLTGGSVGLMVLGGQAKFQELVVWDVTHATKYYSLGGQRIAMQRDNGVVNYIHTDQLGSTRRLTDGAGEAADGSALRYMPYGQSRPATYQENDRHDTFAQTYTEATYTGQYRDSNTELMYYGARFYDPLTGRFISPDSVIPDPFDPQAFNRYSYVVNNPLRYTDPTGHCFFAPPFDTAVCLLLLASAMSASQSPLPPGYPKNYSAPGECAAALPDCFGDEVRLKDFSGNDEGNPIPASEFEAFADKVAMDLYSHDVDWPGLFGGRGAYDTPFYNGGQSERRTGDPNAQQGSYPADEQVCISGVGCAGRSEINYIAQGMWGARTGESKPISILIVQAWKLFEYGEAPSEETLFWLQYGYDYYLQWLEQQQAYTSNP